jgi:hypothetical protein
MNGGDKPIGQPFPHVYLERGAPAEDSKFARARLGGYVQTELHRDREALRNYLKREFGQTPVLYGFEDFFANLQIHRLLHCITVIWRFLAYQVTEAGRKSRTYPGGAAADWRTFVARVFDDENLGYTIDDKGGVHYAVDEEYQRNRIALVSCLQSRRYAAVRHAFDLAYKYLDEEPRDTKAAVRSMFEALEILAKLRVNTSNLNKWVVEQKLKELARSAYPNCNTTLKVIDEIFDGMARWVHGLHNYRHGQGQEEPVAPPVGVAIYLVSSGAAFLRWLVEIDQALPLTSEPSPSAVQ